jgi:hypothetical protein
MKSIGRELDGYWAKTISFTRREMDRVEKHRKAYVKKLEKSSTYGKGKK